jgi:hypothetical protein
MAQETHPNDSIHNSEQGVQDGLTKREYFAAMAMQGILSTEQGYYLEYDKLATFAIAQADALIAELNK